VVNAGNIASDRLRKEVHASRGLAGHKQRALRYYEPLRGVSAVHKIVRNRVADIRISQEFPWIHGCDEPVQLQQSPLSGSIGP